MGESDVVGRSEETKEVLVSWALPRLCFRMPVSHPHSTSTAREALQMLQTLQVQKYRIATFSGADEEEEELFTRWDMEDNCQEGELTITRVRLGETLSKDILK